MSFHLDDLALFARVAALGTLSAAARERDIPVSQVTRALNRLEAACGARLMHRTTHGLSLTDEGDTLLRHGQRMLDTSEELKADLHGRQSEPSGWVRVGVSASVAESIIASSLRALYEKYPRLHIEVLADDRLADMARDGISDLSYVNPGYQPGRFPVFAASSLPFMVSNAKAGSAAIDAWYRAYAAKEMKDVHLCFAFAHCWRSRKAFSSFNAPAASLFAKSA